MCGPISIFPHGGGNTYELERLLGEDFGTQTGMIISPETWPACMDPEKIKRRYGDRLCFWGTIDEQHTLPFGSPADVREEIARRLRTAGKDGGLIIGPTPLENFHAMHETILHTPYSAL